MKRPFCLAWVAFFPALLACAGKVERSSPGANLPGPSVAPSTSPDGGATPSGGVRTLADLDGETTALVLDGDAFYAGIDSGRVGDPGQIIRMDVRSGAVSVLASDSAYGIAVDLEYVYYTNNSAGTIRRIPKAGGAPETLAAGQSNPSGIAVSDTTIYWVSSGDPSTFDGSLVSLPKAGGSPVVIASSRWNPTAVAVTSDSIIWVDAASYNGNGIVARIDLAGVGPVTALADHQAGLDWLSVEGDRVGWETASSVCTESVGGGPISSAPLPAVADRMPSIGPAAIDEAAYYFADYSDTAAYGVVKGAPLAGGASSVVMPSDSTEIHYMWTDFVRTDATSVYVFEYYLESDQGPMRTRVRVAPKPTSH